MEITIDSVTWFECDFCHWEVVPEREELVLIETPWINEQGEEVYDREYACRECAESPALKMNAKF